MDFAGVYKLKRKENASYEAHDAAESLDMEVSEMGLKLMMAGTSFHLLHLKVKDLGSFSAHKALNELYDALPGHADTLIESYQGAAEVLVECKHSEEYPLKVLNSVEDSLSYIRELTAEINELQAIMPYSEIVNDLDTVKSTLNSAKYKLKFLK